MGNALGCAGLGERVAAAARDGDAAEVRRLLEANPGLARCAAFGSLNSPLHLAAAKGHHEIAQLLLENGADVNARNIYGQTALMQACRFGHCEVVQTLLVFRCNVSKVDSLSSRTALHLAAAGGHVKCVRLLLAAAAGDGDRFVNRAASGGVTALHLAALHGHVDCVHLLIDEHADLAAQSLPCVASPMGSIGAGSTPLHYAAAGGEVKCCQILVSRGADRTAVNCNGWLPVDVARTWGCHWLEHVLSPKSHLPIPKFPPSGYLSSPLASVLSIARDCGLVLNSSSQVSDGVDDSDACAVCLERPCNVAAEVCGHELCVKCALDLCSVIKSYDVPGIAGSIPCPLCRSGIASFRKRAASEAPDEPEPELNPTCSGGHCNNCCGEGHQASSRPEKKPADGCRNYGNAGMDSEAIVPLYCAPFTPPPVLS
ncbi:probable E3 ubiquitin-protein ligase XBOS36 isoform X1 [Phragmites australis]|uniref:probable E3 ubiquitin-protein ligase XBOS36 isoform X1 n=1 Tax=Phragmites australis TaxID=29695 RepID=UPI002D769AB2|nr:probable E3 ubiquitin-protein ligase XBOS36 isoform X1 [Phragmites australis]